MERLSYHAPVQPPLFMENRLSYPQEKQSSYPSQSETPTSRQTITMPSSRYYVGRAIRFSSVYEESSRYKSPVLLMTAHVIG